MGTKTFNFVELREVFLVGPELLGRGDAAIRSSPFVGKTRYRLLARFAEKHVTDFSVFKIETFDISFFGDENIVVFYIYHGYSQLIVGNGSRSLLTSASKAIFHPLSILS